MGNKLTFGKLVNDYIRSGMKDEPTIQLTIIVGRVLYDQVEITVCARNESDEIIWRSDIIYIPLYGGKLEIKGVPIAIKKLVDEMQIEPLEEHGLLFLSEGISK